MSSPWSAARSILAAQIALWTSGATLSWVVSGGLSALLLISAGAWTIGAWVWAVRYPERPVPRPLMKAVAVRAGSFWGLALGVVYAVIGSRPGQLDLDPPGVALAAVVLGAMGAVTVGGLSLCGMDAGRGAEPGSRG
jgi:hypothetical protein